MTRRILQVVAVAFSLTLGGGFVYVKAGGVVPGLPFNRPAEPASSDPAVIYGPKSAPVGDPFVPHLPMPEAPAPVTSES